MSVRIYPSTSSACRSGAGKNDNPGSRVERFHPGQDLGGDPDHWRHSRQADFPECSGDGPVSGAGTIT